MLLRSKFVLFRRQVFHNSLMSSFNVCLLHGRPSIGHNGLGLGEEVDFGTQNFRLSTKFDASQSH